MVLAVAVAQEPAALAAVVVAAVAESANRRLVRIQAQALILDAGGSAAVLAVRAVLVAKAALALLAESEEKVERADMAAVRLFCRHAVC